jgi:type IV secretory pathway VirB10-like protein
MRFLILLVSLAVLATSGCAHQKAAAPEANFSDVPGLPPTPAPPPVEVKQKPPPAPTPVPVEAKKKKPKPQPQQAKVEPAPTPAESPSQKLIVTPETGLIGKVETVNQNARYVVLTFPIGRLPAMEQRLIVYRSGLKVGEVKVTGPQIEDNVVADIVEGDSGPGDEVRDK